jgi:NAD(P)-dependent dehydrogenase (short-subunit alcohol dehydrogenase family)
MIFDANNLASVSSLATALEERYTRLDILVCNAGVQSHQWTASKDGWEEK